MAELLHDRYKLLKKCGSGGTGEVYRARDTKLNRLVAIKRVSLSSKTRDKQLDRLLKEAEYLAGVEHPNVVVVHDVLVTDRSLSIIMELVEGTPLLKLIRKKALPEDVFLGYFRQILLALDAVHDIGLVHRDINPKNILLSRQGVIKLVDFGLSARVDDEKPRAGGTLGYMAPETLRRDGVRATFGVDIYSLGFLSYQALLGIAPFKKLYGATKPREWVRWVLSREPFKPLPEIDSRISGALSGIVMKMLQKDPADRYRRVIDILEDFHSMHRAKNLYPEFDPLPPADVEARQDS